MTEIPAEGQTSSSPLALSPPTPWPDAHRRPLFRQQDYLHFFDAAAPLVTFESIDMEQSLVRLAATTKARRTTSTAP